MKPFFSDPVSTLLLILTIKCVSAGRRPIETEDHFLTIGTKSSGTFYVGLFFDRVKDGNQNAELSSLASRFLITSSKFKIFFEKFPIDIGFVNFRFSRKKTKKKQHNF